MPADVRFLLKEADREESLSDAGGDPPWRLYAVPEESSVKTDSLPVLLRANFHAGHGGGTDKLERTVGRSPSSSPFRLISWA